MPSVEGQRRSDGPAVVIVPASADLSLLGPLPPSVTLVSLAEGETPPADAEDAEVVVLSHDTLSLVPGLGRFRRLRLVQCAFAGVEGVLPHVPSGVVVCNAGAGTLDVGPAEWVVAAILAHFQHLPRYWDAQAAGRWLAPASRRRLDDDPWVARELLGSRVLIVGEGAVGRAVRQRLEPFGAAVTGITYRPRPGTEPVDALHRLLPTADVAVVLAPLTSATRRLVDADFLGRLPDGALVVNASRGGLVDQDALLAELTSRRLEGALDVTDPEPLPPDHALWRAPGCTITPHVAGRSRHRDHRIYRFIGDQLRRWLAGQPLANVRDDY